MPKYQEEIIDQTLAFLLGAPLDNLDVRVEDEIPEDKEAALFEAAADLAKSNPLIELYAAHTSTHEGNLIHFYLLLNGRPILPEKPRLNADNFFIDRVFKYLGTDLDTTVTDLVIRTEFNKSFDRKSRGLKKLILDVFKQEINPSVITTTLFLDELEDMYNGRGDYAKLERISFEPVYKAVEKNLKILANRLNFEDNQTVPLGIQQAFNAIGFGSEFRDPLDTFYGITSGEPKATYTAAALALNISDNVFKKRLTRGIERLGAYKNFQRIKDYLTSPELKELKLGL